MNQILAGDVSAFATMFCDAVSSQKGFRCEIFTTYPNRGESFERYEAVGLQRLLSNRAFWRRIGGRKCSVDLDAIKGKLLARKY